MPTTKDVQEKLRAWEQGKLVVNGQVLKVSSNANVYKMMEKMYETVKTHRASQMDFSSVGSEAYRANALDS